MKWYLKPVAIVIAILCVGPFAIPLVWMSPAFKKWQKAVITLLVIAFTIWMVRVTADTVVMLQKRMQELQAALK